tara:strand:- start:103 stop:459 length:357 start_codon:yes stop_codon:yes gene_type:complete
MARHYRIKPTTYAASVNADTAAPTLATDGLPYPDVGVTEGMVMVGANGSAAGDTITVTPFWYDDAQNKWCEGAGSTVTGTGVVAVYCVGSRLYLRFTSVTLGGGGAFSVSVQFMSKGS